MLYYIGGRSGIAKNIDAYVYVYDTDDYTLEKVYLESILDSCVDVVGVVGGKNLGFCHLFCRYLSDGGIAMNDFAFMVKYANGDVKWVVYTSNNEFFGLTMCNRELVIFGEHDVVYQSLSGLRTSGEVILLEDSLVYCDGDGCTTIRLPKGKGSPYSFSRVKKEYLFG